MKKNIIVGCLLVTLFAGCGVERESGEETKNITEQKIETVTPIPETTEIYEDISTLPEEIQEILYNNGTFFEVENQKEYTKESYKLPDNEEVLERLEWGSYIVFDLDRDGETELAVIMQNEYTAAYKEVFDKQEDKVYAYAFPYRGFQMVYTDGAVMESSGADVNCFRTIKFEKSKYEETVVAESLGGNEGCYIADEEVSQAEFYEYIAEYYNEEMAVPWSSRLLDEVIKE